MRHITTSARIWILIPGLLIVLFIGCSKKETVEKPEPILSDAYSLYILDPGPFQVIGPDIPSQKEFLILQSGEVDISFGCYPGAYIATGAAESEIATFARETIQNPNWLPGCNRWMLDGAEVTIGDRWYYYVTLLVRREPDWTSKLSDLQRMVHKREIEIYSENEDRIVRIYYTLRDRDIYIFTLSGPPEDVVISERDIRALLACVRLDATDAMRELEKEETS